jgi:RNA 2',3'-cyclic 3'-phosphodiesterase
MSPHLRLFVAWPLPEQLGRELARITGSMQKRLPAASWPRPESLHLTFAFLGSTPAEHVPAIARALDQCGGFAAAEIRLDTVGFFPNERRPRVAWAGIDPEAPLIGLASSIRRELAAAGVAFDEKPFRPHLTVARIKAAWRPGDVATLRDAFSAWASPSASLDRIVLYSSTLSPQGAVHTELHAVVAKVELGE